MRVQKIKFPRVLFVALLGMAVLGEWTMKKVWAEGDKVPVNVVSNLVSKDQWDNEVNWDKFKTIPKVLVFGGKEAALESRAWGTHFQIKFNQGFNPVPEHLQSLDLKEKVKIIAVASLPDVPSIFKGLFRSGFRKEAATMGMILDFAPGLSQRVGYKDDGVVPEIALLNREGLLVKKFKALVSDDKTKTEIEKSIEALIKEF